MPLRYIGVAFEKLKIDSALEAARSASPNLLERLRRVCLESLTSGQKAIIANGLYRRAKELIQQDSITEAVVHLTESHRCQPQEQLYLARLELAKATEQRRSIQWQSSLLEMQHALSVVCVRSHCTCESFLDIAKCRGLVGDGIQHRLSDVPVFTVGPYYSRWMGDAWTRLLKAVKKQQRHDLLPYMANIAADGLLRHTRFISEVDVVVPVPPSTEKYASRGFAPNDLVAKQLSGRLALPYRPVLARASGTATRDASDVELQEQFTVTNRAQLKGVSVLLVEDIWTWGRTIPICAAKALDAGASAVFAVALGKTEG